MRFWSDTFSEFVKPERNKKGNRRFTRADVENLKVIHHLVKERKMTLEGAAVRMKSNRGELNRRTEVVERLRGIQDALNEMSSMLNVVE